MGIDPRYDMLFEPLKIGPGHGAEPVLSGTPLHRHGARPAAYPGRDARHEGRGRMGRGVHRVLLHAPELGRPTLSRSPRCGMTAISANLAAMADAVHAHGALAGIELWHGGSYVANLATPPAHARGALDARARRSGAIAAHGQGGYRARFRQWHRRGGSARQARRLRHHLCLPEPRLPGVGVSVAQPERAHRRIRRQPREPHAAVPRAARGDAGGGRRSLRGRYALHRQRPRRGASGGRGGARPARGSRPFAGFVGSRDRRLLRRDGIFALRQRRRIGGSRRLCCAR